jgi:hypothetical protein
MNMRSCAAILAFMAGVCATAAQARPPGLSLNGLSANGITVNGITVNGITVNGTSSAMTQLKAVILLDGSVVTLN